MREWLSNRGPVAWVGMCVVALIAAFVWSTDAFAQEAAHDVPQSRHFAPHLHASDEFTADDPRYGLLTPIPEDGYIPPSVRLVEQQSEAQRAYRAKMRGYRQQIRRIRHEHFGEMRVAEIRREGLDRIRQFTDPAAFAVLIEELSDQNDDVVLGVLDHFQSQGEAGQGALARVALAHDDDAIRNEATRRLDTPPAAPVLFQLDRALPQRQRPCGEPRGAPGQSARRRGGDSTSDHAPDRSPAIAIRTP